MNLPGRQPADPDAGIGDLKLVPTSSSPSRALGQMGRLHQSSHDAAPRHRPRMVPPGLFFDAGTYAGPGRTIRPPATSSTRAGLELSLIHDVVRVYGTASSTAAIFPHQLKTVSDQNTFIKKILVQHRPAEHRSRKLFGVFTMVISPHIRYLKRKEIDIDRWGRLYQPVNKPTGYTPVIFYLDHMDRRPMGCSHIR